jgi:hypothetical protein
MRFFLSALIRISMTLAPADLRAKLAGKLVVKPKEVVLIGARAWMA